MRMNIFDSKADVLVCPVNCEGVMGAGLALSFCKHFPAWAPMMRRQSAKLRPGSIAHVMELIQENPRVIALFPTKDRWRDPSKLEYVETGLPKLVSFMNKYDFKSVAMPRLGCGCGGLSWSDVKPLIQGAFDGTGVVVQYV